MKTLAALLLLFAASTNADHKLNVVFILADDLGWGELGCYGQTKIPTPNIDKLAAQGMRFTQHYSGAPVCAPSRCVLMTGRHLGHAEVRGNMQAKVKFPQFTEGQFPLSAQALTIAQVFKNAGYATGAMGKWGLGPVGSTGEPAAKGFDLFVGYNCQALAHSFYPAAIWRNAEQIPLNKNPIPGSKKQPEGEVFMETYIGEKYAPKVMLEEALQFIETKKSEPFFLYLSFIEPHVAMHPPKDSVDKFPKEWDDVPYRGESAYLPHPRPRAGYAAMISDLDGYVGKVMEALEKAGISEKTLVIFTSDNGTTHPGAKTSKFHIGGVDAAFFNSTAGLRDFKGSVYEGGIRVPMIARLPGKIPTGTTNETPGYFADWFPTLCDAAGLEKPTALDGESLWPALTGAKAAPRTKPMVWVFPEYGGQVAVRMGDFKLTRQRLKSKQPGAWEVYDLSSDIGETKNLVAEKRELVHQAEELLRREVAPNPNFSLKIPGVTTEQ
jgi:arylsulfatase A